MPEVCVLGPIDGSVEIRRAGDLGVETTLTDLVTGGGFVTEVDSTPTEPRASSTRTTCV